MNYDKMLQYMMKEFRIELMYYPAIIVKNTPPGIFNRDDYHWARSRAVYKFHFGDEPIKDVIKKIEDNGSYKNATLA
jgi:hypothetical protein